MGLFDFITGGPKKDPEHLTDGNFKDAVVNGGGFWVVDFWGPNCPWCDKMVPTIRILTAKYDGKVRFGELLTSGNPEVTRAYGVKGTPTLIFVKGGQVVERLSGFQSQLFLEEVIAAKFPAAVTPAGAAAEARPG